MLSLDGLNDLFSATFFQHKCEQYWPDSDFKLYGDIKVELIDTEEFADYIIRTFTLTRVSEIRLFGYSGLTYWGSYSGHLTSKKAYPFLSQLFLGR